MGRIGGLSAAQPIDCLARAELARGALHLWKLRKFILNAWRYETPEETNEMEELESLVHAARMPGDYASKVIKKGLHRVLMGEDLESHEKLVQRMKKHLQKYIFPKKKDC